MVHKPIRCNGAVKVAVPFAVLSTASLFISRKAYAYDILGIKPSSISSVFDKLGYLLDKLMDGIAYLTHIFTNPVDFLATIYETLSKVVLTTPTFIFNNSYIQHTSLTFATVSVTLVTILTVYESIMQVTKQKHTKFKDIVKRYFTVSCLTGFAPFLFEKGFSFINKLTQSVTMMGGELARGDYKLIQDSMSGLDLIIMFGFDITLIVMLFPILLQNGRRWWDLMCLAAVSPLAGAAYVFDRHRHYTYSWWNQVKKLSLIQLVYAVFILFLGVFIFGTRSMTGGWEMIFKMLIVAGGMWRMLNPPRIIQSMVSGEGKDVFDMYDDYKIGFKEIADTLTFKNFRPTKFLKGKKEARNKQIKDLRKKHGVRDVSKFMK